MSLKFAVGDLTIHRIIEQETTFLPALEMLPGLTPEILAENRAWMREAKALDEQDVLILCFQSYVIKTPHHTILVDSCIGNDKPRPRPKWNMKTDDTYLRGLASAGISVDDIDFVMCTHLHVDHVGWNTRLENGRWVPTFPKARYVFAKGEFDYWTEQNAKAEIAPFVDSVLPVVEAKRHEVVGNDHRIGDHVRILPTPGHTPGHVAFTFGRGKDDAVFSGDLMHSPIQTLYPELSIKFDVDQAAAATTRRSFLERYCDTDTLCCTAHFPSPVGREDQAQGEWIRLRGGLARCRPCPGRGSLHGQRMRDVGDVLHIQQCPTEDTPPRSAARDRPTPAMTRHGGNIMANLPDIPLPAGIRSRYVDGINGLRMHVLEAGFETSGPALHPAAARLSRARVLLAQGDAGPRSRRLSRDRAGPARLWPHHRMDRRLRRRPRAVPSVQPGA